MKIFQALSLGAAVLSLWAQPLKLRADTTNAPADFKEIYDLIRANLAGETDQDLNRAAVQGLLGQLRNKVVLEPSASDTNVPPPAPVLGSSVVYEGGIACLRVGKVSDGLADKIAEALRQLGASNKLKGLVLDLRFADGHDYATVAAVADLFQSKETPLLDWGGGLVSSKAKTNALALPLVVLVNRDTAAAAEALAAVLRESAQALVVGTNTAGEATVGKEFELKNGQRLRIATAAVKLGGGETLSASGIKPDIAVAVKPEDERMYREDPYRDLTQQTKIVAALGPGSGNGTNRSRTRPNEAELIRERKERPGMDLEYLPMAGTDEAPEKPAVRDPVLARGLDLITAIAALHQGH